MAKINISIDDELLERVDSVADGYYMSRSGLITYALSKYLAEQQALLSLSDIAVSMRKVAANNEIDDETRQQLQNFETLCNLMTQCK